MLFLFNLDINHGPLFKKARYSFYEKRDTT